MEVFKYSLLFLALGMGGMVFEVLIYETYLWITKNHLKEYHFTLARYLFLLLPPLLASMIIIFNVGYSPLIVFLIFAIIGPIIEWALGKVYHTMVGQRLWTYHRFSILGYTSWLTIPFWGYAGILFWLIAKELIQ